MEGAGAPQYYMKPDAGTILCSTIGGVNFSNKQPVNSY